MRGLLLLLGVGAAIYTFLVITHDALPGGKAGDTLAGQTQPNHPVAERLSSWGSYLAPSPSQNPRLATSEQTAPLPSQVGDEASQNSERKPGAEYQFAASEDKPTTTSDSSEPQSFELTKPTPTQVATESTTEPLTVKPVSPNKRHHRSAKPAVRDHVVVANVDPWNARWARRADRRRGLGLFMFRPFGRFAAR